LFSNLVHADRLLKVGTREVSIFILKRRGNKKKMSPRYALALCVSQHHQSGRHPAVFLEQQQGFEVGGAIQNGKELLEFCCGLF